jgi:hypothetical protein
MPPPPAPAVDLHGRVGSLPAPRPDADGLLLRARALPERAPSAPRHRAPPGAAPRPLAGAPRFTALALTDGGGSLALATDGGQVFVLEPQRRRFVQLDALDGPASAAAWVARDRRLLFLAQAGGGVRCYDLASRAFATLAGARGRVRSLSVRAGGGPGGEQLAAAAADGVALWRLDTLQLRRLLGAAPYGVLQAAFAPDEATLVVAAADGAFSLWGASTLRPLGGFRLPRAPAAGGAAAAAAGGAPAAALYPSCFAVTPDGRSIVVGATAPALLLVYDAVTLALRHGVKLPRHRRGVAGLHALPDARAAVVLCLDGSVSVVDFEAAEAEGEVPLAPAGAAAKAGGGGSSAAAGAPPARADAIAVDARGNALAVLTDDGGARLYDLGAARAAMARRRGATAAAAPPGARRVSEGELAALPPELTEGSFPVPIPVGAAAVAAAKAAARGRSGGGGGRPVSAPGPAPGVLLDRANTLPRKGAAKRGAAAKEGDASAAAAAASARAAAADEAAAAAVGLGSRGARLAPGAAAVSRARLEEMLVTWGQYPARYRLLIW